jgi:hypothetical protein
MSYTVAFLMIDPLDHCSAAEQARGCWLERGISATLHLGLHTLVEISNLLIDKCKRQASDALANISFRERSRGNKYDVCSCLHYS